MKLDFEEEKKEREKKEREREERKGEERKGEEREKLMQTHYFLKQSNIYMQLFFLLLSHVNVHDMGEAPLFFLISLSLLSPSLLTFFREREREFRKRIE